MGQKWVKNVFFQKCSWTIYDALTSGFSSFWLVENPEMP